MVAGATPAFESPYSGEPLERVVSDVAALSDVTPAQVLLFLQAVIQAQKQAQESPE